MEIKNKEIAFSTLFFSYYQLKLPKMPLCACKPPHMDENRSATGCTAILKSNNTCATAYPVQVVEKKIMTFEDVNYPAQHFMRKIVD